MKPGDRINMLTYIGPSKTDYHQPRSECVCDCGTVKDICTYTLEKKTAYSCGCERRPKYSIFDRYVPPSDRYALKSIKKRGEYYHYVIDGPMPVVGKYKGTLEDLKIRLEKTLTRVNANGKEMVQRLTSIADFGSIL